MTNYTLNLFNRSATGYQTTKGLTLTGTWTHVNSPVGTLDCSIIYDTVNNAIAPVYYDRVAQTLSSLPGVLVSTFTNVTTLNATSIKSLVKVGSNCSILNYNNTEEIWRQ
jgi:hypothetical protein